MWRYCTGAASLRKTCYLRFSTTNYYYYIIYFYLSGGGFFVRSGGFWSIHGIVPSGLIVKNYPVTYLKFLFKFFLVPMRFLITN